MGAEERLFAVHAGGDLDRRTAVRRRPAITQAPYIRVVQHDGYYYGVSRLGRLSRSKDPLASFELGPNPFRDGPYAGRIRHVALVLRGNRLHVFFTAIGDTPERVMLSTIARGRLEHVARVGAGGRDSTRARLRVHQSSQPAVGERGHRDTGPPDSRSVCLRGGRPHYLFYSICGEQGIAAAEITGLAR